MRKAHLLILAGALLVALVVAPAIWGPPHLPRALNRHSITKCKQNFAAITGGFLEYRSEHRHLPRHAGTRGLAVLITDGPWENTTENALRLTCPGVDPNSLPGLAGRSPTEWFTDLDAVTEAHSAYMARDWENHDFAGFASGQDEILLACDNHTDGSGGQAIVVLTGDLSVTEWYPDAFRDSGHLGPDETLVFGPRSQVPALRALSPK